MPLRTNISRFKEPRGFIKILQFVVAILAFATTAGYYSEFQIKVTGICPGSGNSTNGTYKELVKFGYPFSKGDYYFDGDKKCKAKHERYKLDSNFKSESEFFVFVGVISFLYCIVAMVYYVSFEDPSKYGPGGEARDFKSFSTVDFVVTMVLALFWFAASVAWAAGLTNLKDDVDVYNFIKSSPGCSMAKCNVLKKASYAALTISVLFGFLNCFLWSANIWFAYKETVWHKEPGAMTSAEQPSGEIPRQQVPKEESVP